MSDEEQPAEERMETQPYDQDDPEEEDGGLQEYGMSGGGPQSGDQPAE